MIAASTICGRIGPVSPGSATDRRHLERMRAETGAGLMGAATLRKADPEMRGPDGILNDRRLRAIITSSGRIPLEGKKLFLFGPAPVIFCPTDVLPGLADRIGDRAKIIGLPKGPEGTKVADAVGRLAEMGADSVLLEGGGILNYAALREGIVDEISLTLTPSLSGDSRASSLVEGPAPLGDPFLPLELLDLHQASSGELFLRYRVLNQHGRTRFFPATPAHENQPVLSRDNGVFSR